MKNMFIIIIIFLLKEMHKAVKFKLFSFSYFSKYYYRDILINALIADLERLYKTL